MFKKIAQYLSVSVVATIIGAITVPILTRYISPEEMGFIGIYNAIIYLSRPLLSLRGDGLISINYVKRDEDSYQAFFNVLITLIIVICLIQLLGASIYSIFSTKYTFVLLFAIVVGFFRSHNEIHSQLLVQKEKASSYSLYRTFNSVSILLLTILFLALFDLSWKGRIFALLAGDILTLALRFGFNGYNYKKIKLKFEISELKKIVNYGLPLFFALGATWIIFQGDKMIVLSFFSMKELGLYTVAYQIGQVIDKLNQAYINSIVPTMYKTLNGNKNKKIILRLIRSYIIILLVLVVMAAVGFYYLSGIILGEEYYNSRYITIIVLFAYFFFGIYRVNGLIIDFYKLTKLKAVLMYAAAVVNLALSIGLIKIIGIYSPAIGTLTAFIIMAVLTIYFSRKEMNTRNMQY